MKIRWRPAANLDRVAIYDYIEEESPFAASAVDERILHAIDNLIRFPELGRLGRRKGTRELVIQRTPYVAYYRIAGETVEILRIVHGSRRRPKLDNL